MNKTYVPPALGGLLLTLVLSFADAAMAEWESTERIVRAAETEIARSRPDIDKTELRAAIDPALRLARCPDMPEARIAESPGTSGRWLVEVRCASRWKLYVPVRHDEHRPVVVLVRPLSAGQVLSSGDLRLESRPLSRLPQGYFLDTAAVTGQVLRRSLMSGEPLTPQHLSSVMVVRRGQQVVLVGRSAGFEVRAQGKALADAGLDQRVRVESLSSRRIVEGIVRGTDIVEVGT